LRENEWVIPIDSPPPSSPVYLAPYSSVILSDFLPSSSTQQPQLVGRQKALHLLGAAQPLDPATALEMGLVDKVCDEEIDVHLAAWEFLAPFLRHTTGRLI